MTELIIGDIGELGVTEAIRAIAPLARNGDDVVASAQATLNARSVTSIDILMEGCHFRLDWSIPQRVGAKTAVQNFADIESMGAHPTVIPFTVSAPLHTPVSVVTGIVEGLWQEGKQCPVGLVGGDMVSGDSLVISISATGELGGPGRPLLRSVARAGDTVVASGRIGYSVTGLALLQHCGSPAKAPCEFAQLVAAHRMSEFEYRRGATARAIGVHLLTGNSDGLVVNLHAIVQVSRVTLEADSNTIASNELQIAAGEYLDTSLWEWVLTGGEDHALIGSTSGELPTGFHVIGTVSKEKFNLVLIDGKPPACDAGWASF